MLFKLPLTSTHLTPQLVFAMANKMQKEMFLVLNMAASTVSIHTHTSTSTREYTLSHRFV